MTSPDLCRWTALPAALVAALAVAAPPLPPAANRPVEFARDVRPILEVHCVRCHGPEKQKGSYRLDRATAAIRGDLIIPGRSADSKLIQVVAGTHPELRMPPTGKPLTPEQVGILRAWIDAGAKWPDLADTAGGTHWSLKPLERPPVPVVCASAARPPDAGWGRTPIDAFILAKLTEQGLTPSEPADKRTLIRRVTYDLTGLPPTPEEVAAFLADNSPDAYERVVDRLLAAPAYGERWARLWLDIAHYAETHGHDQDAIREHAWPYRDYLIAALNADKPYARFVQEQLAGDVLFPDDPSATVATGFLAAGPWDESSQKDIRDDTLDKKQAQVIDRDDMVTTAMTAFVSTTIHCARCHDHKFDPITQRDYYGLQAVFAGVDRANRTYDPDPRVARQRRELLKEKADLSAGGAALAARLRDPAVRAELAAWEQRVRAGREQWAALKLTTVRSAGGATPDRMPDGSVCFRGPRPERDTYTLEASTDTAGLTAVRLEVLADDSLPHKGPGRQDNGNLHLSEFRVLAGGKPVPIRRATADFNQDGWDVSRAIDGKPDTAWGIYPAVGRSHEAVFELANPLTAGVSPLTFVLEQNHGSGHLIGRVRLSATTAAQPATLVRLPEALEQILATPAAERTEAQTAELARHVLLEQVEAGLAALPAPQLVYAAAPDFAPTGNFKPARGCRPVSVLRRGDITQPLEPAFPGALSCVSGPEPRFRLAHPNDEGERRAAFARWVTDGRNVLTWRSIVNRVWGWHFGRGIVSTPSDFGRMGAPPSHPELLDWLAVWSRDHGGSLKQLHRLIVTSAVYRQSSAYRPDFATKDADNQYLWRMNRQRLDAEAVRDAVLAVSGRLDFRMGGPSDRHFTLSPGIHVTPNVHYDKFDVDSDAGRRRSVYRFVFRTLPDPFLDTLDCPDASQFTPVRANSVTALQALAMLNDRFMVRQSEHFAARLARERSELEGQVVRGYELALGRPPTPAEVERLAGYARKHGLANACRLLLNCNEFLFVE